ncbi:MAG: hypothetical protein ABWZ88_17530 [Variovorax sp.]
MTLSRLPARNTSLSAPSSSSPTAADHEWVSPPSPQELAVDPLIPASMPASARPKVPATPAAVVAAEEVAWRLLLQRLAARHAPFHKMSASALARILERHGTGCVAPLTAQQMLELVDQGKGELVTTRSALAFTIDHGPGTGIEIRYLLVVPGNRRRGAGSALIAKLRARYAGLTIFCTFSDGQWTRFARLAGFSGRQKSDGTWHVSTDFAAMEPCIAEAEPPGPSAPGTPAQRDRCKVRTILKAICASTAAAIASVSCIDL